MILGIVQGRVIGNMSVVREARIRLSADVVEILGVIGPAPPSVAKNLLRRDDFVEPGAVGGFAIVGMIHFREMPVRSFQRLAIAILRNPQDGVMIDEAITVSHSASPRQASRKEISSTRIFNTGIDTPKLAQLAEVRNGSKSDALMDISA